MLSCQECMRHCLQTLIGDSTIIRPSPRTVLTSILYTQPSVRGYTTLFDPSKEPEDELSSDRERSKPKSYFRKPDARQKWLDERGVRPATKSPPETSISDKVISKHLQYLNDPLKLSNFVRDKLRRDEFELALTLVHAASKNNQCTVSWNHLVDWQMSKGRMNAAIKTYNEMKKRRQNPDSHTYTILFRGCADHPLASQALPKVLMIYQSMLSDRSPIKPNQIHLNAVLKMCARARNLESMFTILDQMPDKGLSAPDNMTFTTILNAIRMDAVSCGTASGATPMEVRDRRRKAMLDGRRIWQDVVKRWRNGDIKIDEELACAMGRLLLIGEQHDFDDILSLIEQTMNIPRPIPSLGTRERLKIEPAGQGKTLGNFLETVNTNISTSGKSQDVDEDSEGDELVAWDPKVLPTTENNLPTKPDGIYAKPGRNALSLVVEASSLLKKKDCAQKYWKIFTENFKVKPDAENYHDYLRILRANRASTETVQLLLNMPRVDMQVKTFRIAMAACARDKLNQHAFSNSGKVLDMMQMVLKEPDVPVLQNYLETAISSPVYHKEVSPNGKRNLDKLGQGRQILRALQRLNPSYLNLKAIIMFEDPMVTNKGREDQTKLVNDVIALMQNMVRAHDLLMNRGLVEREMYLDLTKQRSKLASFINRRKHGGKSKDGATTEDKVTMTDKTTEPEGLQRWRSV